MRTILIPISVLMLSIGWLYLLVTIAPNIGNHKSESDSLRFPNSLTQLKQLSDLLMAYSQVNGTYVFILFCSAYLFKQTFAIPGSLFLNLLAGALYGVWLSFPLCCLLTAIGASFCYTLSAISGKHYVIRYFPKRVEWFHQKVMANRSQLIYVLLFLRLFPMTPNWFLNIASPIIQIPIHLFFISVFIGLMPYNFVCVQTGSILSQLQSLDDVLDTSTVLKLIAIAMIALLPGFLFKRKKDKIQ
ncbi:transmembrane protein 41A-like [Oppia nitens]|uniref:transmembrane protein 41A-like n=1 Tax=Oppia nitens TaxID=1686743 RepID=UPI0023D9B58A|nr:transmembrane protein 41A-like [Oppia nitens]